MYAMAVNGDYKKSSQIHVKFQYPSFVNDAQFSMLTADAFPDFSFNTLVGVLDANVAVLASPAPTTTVFTVDIFTVYGSLNDKAPIPGLTSANITDPVSLATAHVYDVTSSATHAITSMTESALVPGRYTITLTVAVTASDAIIMGLSLPGYDGTLMSQVQIVL
jgi:hypothetical protein